MNIRMDEKLKSAIEYGWGKNGFSVLKPNQGEIIQAYLSGYDVLFCSPTGSGKSLSFEIAPFAYENLLGKSNSCTCIVVSPLTALMKTQVETLQNRGIRALYLRGFDAVENADFDTDENHSLSLGGVKNGDYQLLFASPETLLQNHRDLVLHIAKKGILKTIFIDEAHCIKKFGKSDHKTKQPAYRPFYGQLGELRSLAGPSVPLVALTATASKATRELIMKDLCMNEQTFKLVVDPNKENIKYSVVNTNFSRADIANDFDWLVELLKEKGKDAPRMIIFFRKIDHISDVYEHLETSLGPSAYVDYQQEGPNDDRNRLFDMYHLKTDEAVKESVAASYQDPNGITRVVLCSTSFSMGLDVKGVNTIIHYGPSSDLDDYIQESGRAGRQPDDNAHAVIMRYKRCLSSKNISKEMKTFIKTKTCRRQVLLEPFIEKFKALQNGHDCCDICALTCSCLCYCDSGSICSCEIMCSNPVSEIVSAMKTTTLEEADGNSSWEDSSSDSDIEAYRARKPIVLTYSDDNDYE